MKSMKAILLLLIPSIAFANPVKIFDCATGDKFENTKISIPTTANGDSPRTIYLNDDGYEIEIGSENIGQFKNYNDELFVKFYTLDARTAGYILEAKHGSDGILSGKLIQFIRVSNPGLIQQGKTLSIRCSIN
jgi:hypothetical protein